MRLLLILGAVTAIGPLSIDAYLPAFPEISAELGAGASGVQLSLTSVLVGMATGQLLVGPLSDSWGRRRPVLAGMAAYAVLSAVCAIAPTVELLVAARLVQGLAGGAGVVVARAVVRDVASGAEAVRFFSRLTLVFGLAPILAPLLGSLLLAVTGWRGIFLLLAAIGFLLVGAVAAGLPETLPPDRRRPPRLGSMLATMGELLRDRRFVGYALALGLGFGGMFAYISGSSFALQEGYGASPAGYAAVFGGNAVALVLAGQVSGWLAGRVPAARTLLLALAGCLVAAVALLAATATKVGGLATVVGALVVFAAGVGFVIPNAISLALERRPDAAGTASALVGFQQSVFGAVLAPLTGLGPGDAAVSMALVMTLAALAALAAMALTGRWRR